jgi:hypothetical protein
MAGPEEHMEQPKREADAADGKAAWQLTCRVQRSSQCRQQFVNHGLKSSHCYTHIPQRHSGSLGTANEMHDEAADSDADDDADGLS